MKLSQKAIARIIIIAVMVVYNALLFLITSGVYKNATFWWAYAFVMLPMVVVLLYTFFPLRWTNGTNLVFGLPIFRIFASYAITQILLGTLFMLLKNVLTVKWLIIIELVVLVIFVVIFFMMISGANYVSQNVQVQKEQVLAKNMTYARVAGIAKTVEDADLQQKLSFLADKIRYSDYKSYPQTKQIELKIDMAIDAIEECTNNDELSALIKKLDNLVDQRAEMLKLAKKM